jgi:hypothetical protein
MRHVDSDHVHACFEEGFEAIKARRSWPNGADDFSAASHRVSLILWLRQVIRPEGF